MNRKRAYWLIPLWVAAAGLLAFSLRETVMDLIIRPLLYLFWILNILYRAIPQVVLWVVLLAVMLLFIISFFLQNLSLANLRPKPKLERFGPVETLAQTIQHKSAGVYFKWQVARSLSEIGLGLQALRTHAETRSLDFDGTEVDPAVRQYLEAGLNSSFADYPVPNIFQPKPKTPFDLELDGVLTYLESQTESDQ